MIDGKSAFLARLLAATSFVCCCNVYSGTTYGGKTKPHGVYLQTTSDSSSGELDQKVERLGCEESLPDGIHFLSKDGKSISKQDVESFAVWGKDLRSVAAVVVKIPVDEVGGTLGVDGLKEMLKIDAYKKNLFSNPEGTWHLGEWGRKDSVALYVIEQWRFSKSKVWKADNLDAIVGNRHFMQMPDDKPVVFKDLAHDAIPSFSKKVISARDLNRVRNELWEDKDFAAKCKEAHDAVKNIQGDIARTAPPVQPAPSLFPELDHLKEPPLFPELEHLKHRNAEQIAEEKPRRNVHQERRTPQRRNTSKETPSAAIGVRGWCECGDNHGKLFDAGTMIRYLVMWGLLNELGLVKRNENAARIDDDMVKKMVLDARYSYILCGKCGKCRRPSVDSEIALSDSTNKKEEDVIIDNIVALEQLGAEDFSSAQKIERAMIAPQKEFLSKFPNGGVLFPGACVCKVPDPVHVGFLENDYSPYVCLLCGHERLPDETGSMPRGPTALRESGLEKHAKQEERKMTEWFTSIIQSNRD